MKEFGDFIIAFLDSGRWLKLLIFVVGAMVVWIMVKVQRGKNGFDFKDMIMEDGKGSPTKFFTFGCFIATTWAFILAASNNSLNEWFFNGYILLWCGNRLWTKYLDQKKEIAMGLPPQKTTTTTQTTPDQTVTTVVAPSSTT